MAPSDILASAEAAASIARSSVYRGQHFPSDVVWGALLGSVWLAFGRHVVLRPVRGPSTGNGAAG